MPEREKVIKALEERISTCSMICYGFDVVLNGKLADDILALLKEQETEMCDRCGRRRVKSDRKVK